MTGLYAVLHILSAIIVLLVTGFLYICFVGWLDSLNKNDYLQELSLNLGIPKEELDKEDNQKKIIEYGAQRNSTELLRNRVSDLFGFVLTGWGWLSNILQACILIWVIWITVTENVSNAVMAWWIVGVGFFFSIVSIASFLVCKLFTGRYPGQARSSRKLLAQLIEDRNKSHSMEY